MAVAMTSSKPVSNRAPLARLPSVCVSVQATSAAEMLARAEHVARDNSLIELRLDYLKAPQTMLPRLRDFCTYHPQVTVIATCRKVQHGGKFRGSTEAELAILRKAAEAGCDVVDLSLQSAERLSESEIAGLRAAATLMISYHDFAHARKVNEVFERMRTVAADIYKLVFTANTFSDSLKVLDFVDATSAQVPVVAFCMGETGIASRVLSLRAGSTFTYASLAPGEETAPGQIDIRTLRQVYRIDQISRATRVYGLLGHPLTHSLSPVMLNAAFRRESVNGVYLPLPTRNLDDVLRNVERIPLHGFSVTQPYKSAILARLAGVDALARKVGAVNTVVRTNGKLYGFNTDVAGILAPLQATLPLKGARTLVIGAGGAARAAVFGLREQGAHVSILNRTAAHAAALAKSARAQVVRRNGLKKLQFDVIINATPVGQFPHVKQSPLEAAEIHAAVAFDLVYNPFETEFLRRARAAGAKPIHGIEMFVVQGARQFEIWTAKPAPLEEMRREALAALLATNSSNGTHS
jgi:3-dehydroquinate dehydratase/shikimate dehydrogenase